MTNVEFNKQDIESKVIEWRRHIHQNPEYGFDLPETVAYVCKALDEMGVEYHTLVNGSAVVGLIKGEKGEGKTVALRADMDALKVKEETGLPFASTNGYMHACGHDAHTAMLLGAAYVLNSNRDKFAGNVKLLFQPSEEQDGGAKPMIDEGCLENPKVDYVIGQHVGALSDEISLGEIGFYPGTMMASLDEFRIDIIGQGGHGAMPHRTIDPIVITASVIQALQTMMRREINSLEPAVFTIGQIHGGTAYNIVPDKVNINGTVRCLNEDVRKYIQERATAICQGVAESFRGKVEVNYINGYPSLYNDVALTEELQEMAKGLFGEEKIMTLKNPTLGSEDFAFFSREVPSCYVFINTAQEFEGKVYPNHNSKFMVDESQLINGVSYFAHAALYLLNK